MRKQFTDQMGQTIEINFPPKRIISLVPSQSELLFDLGLNKEVVGITKFCIHPNERFKSTAKIGGTKRVDIEKIRLLKPDLIIGNKEENQKEQIETLMQEFPIWISDIVTLDDAYSMIRSIGSLVDKETEANGLAQRIHDSFIELFQSDEFNKIKSLSPRVAYFIWKDPYMVVANNTFIDHVLSVLGFKNIFSAKDRYTEITKEELRIMDPEYVFLSSEPYPFKDKHVMEMSAEMPQTRFLIVDGEMFSWYGSRLLHAPKYFKKIFTTLL
ncbi:helical backbone metal receptor [Solitalea sp. MAHUQ-68]|uniref:Helical backbone metal receptor n=1 Tax=Solitalea agri TaxID=2953739 RepID=A0A9X2F3R5_9SPHI|nr:helical backbone metal receptor [Solitalea agri]MCO4293736.1 helical backbone metal receptor [Solitalea agri]